MCNVIKMLFLLQKICLIDEDIWMLVNSRKCITYLNIFWLSMICNVLSMHHEIALNVDWKRKVQIHIFLYQAFTIRIPSMFPSHKNSAYHNVLGCHVVYHMSYQKHWQFFSSSKGFSQDLGLQLSILKTSL